MSARSLIHCIRRYWDHEEIPRLEQWLGEKKDWANSSAFAALALLDPDRAISHLQEIPVDELAVTRNWWLPELLFSRREQTQAQIRTLMQKPEGDPCNVASIYESQENEMDGATVDIALDALLETMKQYRDDDALNMKARLYRPLALLARISRYDLVLRFEARAASELELLLADHTCSWVSKDGGYFDHELHDARLVLLKMGGPGITKVINSELAIGSTQLQPYGLMWILVRPDPETRKQLRTIVQNDLPSETLLEREVQIPALRALAALGEDEAVVDAILQRGFAVPTDLVSVRRDSPPMGTKSLQNAKTALGAEDEYMQAQAILALGMSGRMDSVPLIHQRLTTAPGESHLAKAAVIALQILGDNSPETVHFLTTQLSIPHHAWYAMEALLRIGTNETLDALEKYLGKFDPKDYSRMHDTAIPLALALSELKPKRLFAARTIWQGIKDSVGSSWPNQCFEVIGDLDDPEVRELLWEQAFPLEGTQHYRDRSAFIIQGLAKLDPEAAFRAAEVALVKAQSGRESLPNVLLELDPPRAVPILCRLMPSERETQIRWAIGRALRLTEQSNCVRKNIKEMLKAPDAAQRQAGAELCGWQSNKDLQESLHRLLDNDSILDVRTAALHALQQQREEQEVIKLMEVFRSALGTQRWSLLESILSLGNPHFLGNKDDPLWVGQILRGEPFVFWQYAQRRLEKRLEEMKKSAEKTDREKR